MYEPSTRQRRLAAVAAAGAVTAAALHVLGGAAVERVTGVFVGVAVVATLGVLHVHGRRRDSGNGGDGDSDDEDGSTERRQREAEARKSGGDFL